MPHPPLGFLLVLNAVLLVAVYLAAGPSPRAEAQLAAGGAAGARYTMVASRTDGRNQEATVYVIDLQNGAAVPIRFKENKERFEFSRGRSLRADVAAVAGRPDAR